MRILAHMLFQTDFKSNLKKALGLKSVVHSNSAATSSPLDRGNLPGTTEQFLASTQVTKVTIIIVGKLHRKFYNSTYAILRSAELHA